MLRSPVNPGFGTATRFTIQSFLRNQALGLITMSYPPLKSSYRIMIVDDHKFVVELLAQKLSIESKIEVVGMANNGSSVLHIVKSQKIDIVLLDMELDKEDGIYVVRELLKMDRTLWIIGLSMHDADHYPISLLEIGGLGFISKNATGREIVDGIMRVAMGEMAISPKITVFLATQCVDPSPVDQIRALSGKEQKILKCIAERFSVAAIATKFSVVDKTILSHRNRLRKN